MSLSSVSVGSPDLHYKMCKKIALLTKVIYHLNIKNEDHDAEISTLKRQHSEELAKLGADAADKLKHLSEMVQTANAQELTRLQDALVAARAENEKRKKEAEYEIMRRDEDYRKSVDQLKVSFAEKSHAMSTALCAAQKQFNDKIILFESQFSDWKAEMGVKQTNQATALAAATAQYEQQLAAAAAELQRVKQTAGECETQLHHTIAENAQVAQREINVLQADLQAARAENTRLAALLEAAGAQTAELQTQLNSSFDTLANMKGEINGLEDRASKLSGETQRLSGELVSERSSVAALRAQLLDVESRNASLSHNSASLTEALRSQLNEALADAANWRQRTSELQRNLTAAQEEMDRLRQNMGSSLQSTNDSLRHAEDQIAKLKTDLAAQAQYAAAQIKTLEDAVHASETSTAETVRRHAEESSHLKLSHAAEVERLKLELSQALLASTSDSEFRLAALRQEFDKKILEQSERLQAEHREKLDAVQATHSKHIEDLVADYHRQLLEKEKQLANAKGVHDKYVSETDETIQTLRAAVMRAEAQGGTVSDHLSKAEQEKLALSSTVMQMEKQCRDLEEKLGARDAMIAEWARKHDQLVLQLESQRSQARADIDRVERSHQEAMARFATETEERLQSVRVDKETALAALRQQYESRLSSVSQVVEVERSKFSGSLQELQDLYDRTRAELTAKVKQLEEELELERRRAEKELRSAVDDVKLQAAQQLARQQEEHDRLHATQQARHADDIEVVKLQGQQTAKAVEDRLRASHLAELAELESARAAAAETAGIQMRNMESKHTEEISSLRAALSKEADGFKHVNSQFEKLRHDYASLLKEHETQVAQLTQSKEAMQQDLQLRLQQQEQQYSNRLRQATMDGENAIARLNEVLTALQAQHQADVEDLKRTCVELEEKYKARESRPEDVIRIKKLTQVIKSMDEELRKTQEEMKFFKLELINRETNFNKVFNRNPNIGVLNPSVPASPTVADSRTATVSAKSSVVGVTSHTSSKSLTGAAASIINTTAFPLDRASPSAGLAAHVDGFVSADSETLDSDDEARGIANTETRNTGSSGSASIILSRPPSGHDLVPAAQRTPRRGASADGMPPLPHRTSAHAMKQGSR